MAHGAELEEMPVLRGAFPEERIPLDLVLDEPGAAAREEKDALAALRAGQAGKRAYLCRGGGEPAVDGRQRIPRLAPLDGVVPLDGVAQLTPGFRDELDDIGDVLRAPRGVVVFIERPFTGYRILRRVRGKAALHVFDGGRREPGELAVEMRHQVSQADGLVLLKELHQRSLHAVG